VRTQLAERGIRDARVLDAMHAVPRHEFVPEGLRQDAYEDHPLPIGEGQTISQPYIVALMTSLAALQGDENVLEIGTGSGYQAAVLACLARTVHTIERHPALSMWAASTLADLGYKNVSVHQGDGSSGWPEAAPYQAILVTAAAPRPPQPLLDQLAEDGRLIIPVGERRTQDLQVWRREGGHFSWEAIIPVAFVPMRGELGWKEDQWPDPPIQYY
jgi:protein-L-isoaspartate(D-aspartate) O-methyltransferase